MFYFKREYDEAMQMDMIKRDLKSIQFITNPTKEVQLYVIKKDYSLIRFISKPSPMVQMVVAKSNVLFVRYIESPCEGVLDYINTLLNNNPLLDIYNELYSMLLFWRNKNGDVNV